MKWTGPNPLKGEIENVGGKTRNDAAPGKRIEIKPGEKIPNNFLHESSVKAFKKKGWIDGNGKPETVAPPRSQGDQEGDETDEGKKGKK